MRRLGRLRWLLPVTAVLLAAVPFPATVVERWYTNGAYCVLQSVLTWLSNLAPFALLDLAGCLAIAAFLALAIRELTTVGWRRAVRWSVGRLVIWSAVAYILFALA